jgi:hypothetical protein
MNGIARLTQQFEVIDITSVQRNIAVELLAPAAQVLLPAAILMVNL